LNLIGILFGTDKSSLRQDYLIHYERELAQFRDEAFNLLEIRIHNGASLTTWQAYFTKATIVGIDNIPRCREYARGRIAIEIGSQDDGDFLSRVVTKYPPKVIIDDGSHRADHQIFTFEHLFPTLQAGGCYVVEDLSWSPNPRWRGNSPISAVEYFSKSLTRNWWFSWSSDPSRDKLYPSNPLPRHITFN